MSKSLGNYVGIAEPPGEMFGKLMSISDELMARYSLLLLGEEIDPARHPLEEKKALASSLVRRYHGDAAARDAVENWNRRGDLDAAELPSFSPAGEGLPLVALVQAAFDAIGEGGKSSSEVRRLVQQGSIQLNGEKLTDPRAEPALKAGDVLKLNKKRSVRIA